MAARTYFSAQSLTEDQTGTVSAATPVVKATLAATFTANTDVWLIWAAMLNRAGAGTNYGWASLYDGASDLCDTRVGSVNAAEYQCTGGIARFQEGASPAERTFNIRYRSSVDAANTKIKEATLVAIEANADDEYAESLGVSSTNSTTFQDKLSLTFTPATEQEYIVIGSAEMTIGAGGISIEARLDIDGSSQACTQSGNTGDISALPQSPVLFVYRVNLTAASHTIKIQYRRTAAGATNISIQNARLLAIPASVLEALYGDQDSAVAGPYSTDTTPQDRSTFTQTPAALDHLLLGYGLILGANSTNPVSGHIEEGGTDLIKDALYGARYRPTFLARVEALAASSTTWKTQYSTANTGTAVSISDSSIQLVQLEAAGGGDSLTVSDVSLLFAVENVGLENASSPLPTDNVALPFEVEEPQLQALGLLDPDDVDLPFDAQNVTLAADAPDANAADVELPFVAEDAILDVPGASSGNRNARLSLSIGLRIS